ncbi:MAG: hypothetical protein GY913_05715 [Proteobacteria bacterium]|nr:hypothetical protein [Pseudomonadota bacterium]MCP4916401.1 hypothetical protein [Pseudomonadota bacterium]
MSESTTPQATEPPKRCRRGRRRRGRGVLAVLLVGGLTFAAGKATGHCDAGADAPATDAEAHQTGAQ